MESVLGRYRNLIILVGVLFLQVLGLATQVKRASTEARDTRLIRVWVVGAITPLERGLVWIQNGTGNIWHNYFYLRGVRAENRQLKDQIEQMRLDQVRLSEDAAQAHRLQTLLAFKEQFISKTVAAQVIGSGGMDSSRVIYIDKGRDAGIQRDMGVITADGIVGKVLMVYPSVSQVLLINDQSSGVGVILGDDRLQGWLGGTANGEVALNDVMSDEQVPIGEKVLTSGGDRIFPKGLPVGTVTKVANGKDLFLNIKIKPAANLSKLEEVLVLVEKQERQATADDSVRVRAADILAQRLPSVPDKPPADANAGANTAASSAPSPAAGPAEPAANTASGTSTGTSSLKPAANTSASNAPPSAASSPSSNTPSPKTVVPAVKKPSSGVNAAGASAPGQPATSTTKPPNQVSVVPVATSPKTSSAVGTATGSKPDSAPTKPATTQPKPVKPSVPPPSQTTPPANEGAPH